VNEEHRFPLIETFNGTHRYTVGVLAVEAGFSNDVRHVWSFLSEIAGESGVWKREIEGSKTEKPDCDDWRATPKDDNRATGFNKLNQSGRSEDFRQSDESDEILGPPRKSVKKWPERFSTTGMGLSGGLPTADSQW
jgi:hypothetical protein